MMTEQFTTRSTTPACTCGPNCDCAKSGADCGCGGAPASGAAVRACACGPSCARGQNCRCGSTPSRHPAA